MDLGHVPRAWQSTRVAFISEVRRASYVSLKDVRLISLTSFLVKYTERLVDRFITEEVLSPKFLRASQNATRQDFQQG